MLRTCRRCGLPYSVAKSLSSLRLTYCGVLCETADLGFVIDEFLKLPPRTQATAATQSAAQGASGRRISSELPSVTRGSAQ